MLKLSLEVPTARLKEWSPLLDLDFVLAHKVLTDKTYAEFFAQRPQGRQVILDNSTHEFGKPIPTEDLCKATNMVHADVIIAPDIVTPDLPDEQYTKNLEWLVDSSEALWESCGTHKKIGAVLCGNTPMQLSNYIYRAYGRAEVLCFTFHEPKRLEWWDAFSHHPLFRYWEHIHILGMASLEELRHWVDISWKYPAVKFSFDTCKPLKWGVQGKKLSDIQGSVRGSTVKSKEVLEMKTFTKEQETLIIENIEFLKKVCRGEA